MPVLLVGGESVEEEEDVAAAGDAVTDAGALAQQAFLPDELATAPTCLQVPRLSPHDERSREQVHHSCRQETQHEQL